VFRFAIVVRRTTTTTTTTTFEYRSAHAIGVVDCGRRDRTHVVTVVADIFISIDVAIVADGAFFFPPTLLVVVLSLLHPIFRDERIRHRHRHIPHVATEIADVNDAVVVPPPTSSSRPLPGGGRDCHVVVIGFVVIVFVVILFVRRR
jgi:hypothetical protein